MHLVSALPPSVNHYLAYRAIIKNGKPLAVSYTTQEALRYRSEFAEYVREEVLKQGWETIDDRSQHYYIDAVFYFDQTGRDCNNYFKVMLDAITDTKLIWQDDNVTCERVQRIYYDSKNPRVELVIHPVEYIGIFDSESQRDKFMSRCVECTRYKHNCSILNKALVGKIQPEINDWDCSKYKCVKHRK